MNARNALIIFLSLTIAACAGMGGDYGNHRNAGQDSRHHSNSSNDYYAGRGHRDYCDRCGVIERIRRFRGEPQRTSGGGVVIGAVIGGALGNQIGHGDGRAAATVVGAVAGGVAGNAIERNSKREYFEITVRLESGEWTTVKQDRLNGLLEGMQVAIDGNGVHRR